MRTKKLSVIVPVYKGEKFIRKNLVKMKRSLSEYFRDFEIIVVIDGFVDKSFSEARKAGGSKIKVVGYKKNMGKGFALKYGFRYVTGEVVTFLDADLDINPTQLRRMYPYISAADMVIGSKRHPFSKLDYPLSRKILSKGYSIFTRIFFGLKLKDTQSGIKLMKRDLLEVIMPYILVKRYAFDLELCFLAQKHGFRIVEAPVEIKYQFSGSAVNSGAVRNIFIDTLAIWYRYYILRYYQKK